MAVSFNKFRYFRRKNNQKIIDGVVNPFNFEVDDAITQINDLRIRKNKKMSQSTSFEYIRMLNRIT